jgi:4-amino-4-deoxy-L-arabinose transferase-like glycosyltransferase
MAEIAFLVFGAIAVGGLYVALTIVEDRGLRQKRSAQVAAGTGLIFAVASVAWLVSIIAFDLR